MNIIVTKSTNSFLVCGETTPAKFALKANGGIWDRGKKCWKFPLSKYKNIMTLLNISKSDIEYKDKNVKRNMSGIFDFAPSVSQSSKVYLAKCNFSKLFVPKSLKILSSETKASASETVIIFGKLRTTSENVVIKISFPDIYNYENSGLLSEIELYKTINTLLIHKFTPNVAKYIGFWECNINSLMNTIITDQRKIFKKSLDEIYQNNPYGDVDENSNANMLVIEKINGISFDNYVDSTQDEKSIIALIFQVIYTLNVFNVVGIRHGDLHMGNIMIDSTHSNTSRRFGNAIKGNITNNAKYITYVLEPSIKKTGSYYNIPSNVLAKIYDWDFGGIYNPVFNFPKIDNIKADDMCNSISSCNRNTKGDLYTFLGTLWYKLKSANKYQNIISFIERNINIDLLMFGMPGDSVPGPTFDKLGGFHFRLCNGPLVYDLEKSLLIHTGNKCTSDWEPPNELIKMPYDILSDQIFDQWKHTGVIRNHSNNIYGIWKSYEIFDAYHN